METKLGKHQLKVHFFNTVVVGSGAAGFNAADKLYTYGQKNIALITEGLNMGTSRNTGSDKQTYYKLNLSGKEPDSVYDMAQTLFNGGAIDGDIALVEAALSAQCFFNLVNIGVPFPHNKYGEFVGYKTDHDPRQRASSVGPLTSKVMVEKLQEQVVAKGITIFDGYQVIAVLTDKGKTRSVGLLTLNLNELADASKRFVLFSCTNIVYATGGPAGMYQRSVYPSSQTGASGAAFEAGVIGKNLTESQYGIASLKFRWNLSGTYQQVLPRYISTNQESSDEREFLQEYFPDPQKMLDAIFLKGYQWPFDPRKVLNYGSSLIDILVYHEMEVKGRRVFLDYRKNPSWQGKELDFSWLGEESYTYLKNSDALFGTPIERLAKMNQPAIELYRNNGIDLYAEPLEIGVCAQHNNGGLMGNIWWESNLRHFFPVGEVNGTHGIYRPGGSALNSGQVGSTRAAQYIAWRYREEPLSVEKLLEEASDQIAAKLEMADSLLRNTGTNSSVTKIRQQVGELMDRSAAYIRSMDGVQAAIKKVESMLQDFVSISRLQGAEELGSAFKNYDILLTAFVYLRAIEDYLLKGGRSRGSYQITDADGELPLPGLPEMFRFSLAGDYLSDQTQLVSFNHGRVECWWRPVKPIPQEDNWFETVWEDFRENRIMDD